MTDQAKTTDVGFVSQQQTELSPALAAEQQRALAEIQGALTIAFKNPRDEQQAMNKISVSCQRVEMAAGSEYEYSRGGTQISGASVKLMEVIAQKWGNIDFGFRELARDPGTNGKAGESVVEAYAWDLETNTRRKVQFTVRHEMKSGDRMKTLTDPRDIYEYVANQAQRRVRTCLENVIPRDIIDSAREECRKTLVAKEPVTPEVLKKLEAAFAGFGVTKQHIEARLQRNLQTMSSAQLLQMKRIFASLRDGMADPSEFFDMAPKKDSPTSLDELADVLKKPDDDPFSSPKQNPAKPKPPKNPPLDPPPASDVAQDAAADRNVPQDADTKQPSMFDPPATQDSEGSEPSDYDLLSEHGKAIHEQLGKLSNEDMVESAVDYLKNFAIHGLTNQDALILQGVLAEKEAELQAAE